jgi:hypothetical protein
MSRAGGICGGGGGGGNMNDMCYLQLVHLSQLISGGKETNKDAFCHSAARVGNERDSLAATSSSGV